MSAPSNNRVNMTLAFVHDENRVLLGLKKRGFGAGRWNGFGGKVRDKESILAAARRELVEESGFTWVDGQACGQLDFTFREQPLALRVYIFRVTEVSGMPQESDEMQPRWFAVTDLPYADMWPDDRYWLSDFLRGKNVRGHFLFHNDQTILSHDVKFWS